MTNHIEKPIKSRLRLGHLPEQLRRDLKAARERKHWSQAELAARATLAQPDISNIETGKTVPRFDTLSDIVRVLGYDFVLVPHHLVADVRSIIRHGQQDQNEEERSLWADDKEESLD